MRRSALATLGFAAVTALSARNVVAQTPESISVIPKPVTLTAGRGQFTLTGRTTIWTDRADSVVARRLARELAPSTGFDLAVRIGSSNAGNRIVFRNAAARDTSFGAEGYRLEVKPGVITITSAA
ncbi:MAG: glycoside hydrolase family 20 zincin-like fold domain-containing protein, partial [Gemmatimonadaceae bacterium]